MTRFSSSELVAFFYSWRVLLAVVCAAFLIAFPAVAQNSTGRIIGTVMDAQGAAIAGAKVTVTNTATNAHWESVSGSDGAYQVLELPIGNYSVTAEHEGFTKAATAALPLEINQSLRIDVHMKVGSIAEVVKVEAAAVQVETVNPTVGGTVTGATVQNLPLNGRNTLDLALTMPGVTPAAPLPVGGNGVPTGGLSVAGGRDDSVTYLIDGGDNTSLTYGAPVVSPNPDTVAEFRILSNNYTAEFGRSAGGVVSVVTKSGTNSFHGTLFDYLRNDAFNANNFFNKSNGTIVPRPVLKRNQFGGTIGGPISIPGVLNGKDRFFFFFGYQGQRQTSVTVGNTQAVYTPAELTGDFSHSASGAADPGVVCFLTGFFPGGTGCAKDKNGNPIPGVAHTFFQPNAALAAQGIIDPTKINSVAQAYIAAGLVPSSSTGLLTPNGSGKDNRDEYTGKFDFNATQNDRISLTLTKFHNPQEYPFLPTQAPNVSGFPATNQFDNYFGNIAYTKTISQTMLNDFHLTAQRAGNSLNNPARRLPGPANLGVNVTPDQVTGPPQILLNVSGPQLGFNINGPAFYADTTYVYADTFTWTKGRHTWKFGGSEGIVQNNAFFDFAVDGQFDFDGPAGIGSGNDRADFLIGAPDIYEQFPRGLSAIRSHQYAVFAQDEWKVTPRLVLTLGVRYEYNTPKSDPQKRQYMIIPGRQSQRYPNAPTGLVFPGDPGTPSGIPAPDKNNWAPRFGFAWDPSGNGKTSVRGGFGIFYDVLKGLDNQFQNGTPPFFAAAFFNFLAQEIPANGPSPLMSQPYANAFVGNPLFGIQNPFPSSALPSPQQLNFANVGFLPFGPSSVLNNPFVKTPYIYQYNLSVQRQMGSGLVGEIGYVGSSSHRLTTTIDQDPIDLKTGVRILNEQPNLNIPGAWGAAVGTGNGANANYNGLLASLTKRMGDWHSIGQTFFTLSYTWAHELDDSSGQFRNTQQVPAYEHHRFYSSGDSDIRNRLVLSGGWELPFAHLFSNAPKELTRGWTLYPIAFVQSGLPMDVTAGLSAFGATNPSGAGDANLVKPDWTGGSPQTLDPHQTPTISVPGIPAVLKGHFIFNPDNLSVPACYLNTAIACPPLTYGDLQRNFFRGPRRVNFDLSLEKRTKLFGEGVEMTVRGEFFNILNHTEWANPPGGAASVFSPLLGQVTSTFDPRIGQVSLRFAF